MAFSKGKQDALNLEEILTKVKEIDIINYYLGVTTIPCVINSPLRKDNNPSFGLYSSNGTKICYLDYTTKESGGIIDLLMQMWNTNYKGALEKLSEDLPKFNYTNNNLSKTISIKKVSSYKEDSNLQCKIREWKDYDIAYWESYGVSLKWLKYAEVYPISHKIITKENKRYILGADKYAYAYVERKEGKITLKIYQPYNKEGYKWSNKHDTSVISLWTKVPEYGDKICICASLKDALCLWSNTGIPCIATQGEGYNISNTAIKELKRRYKKIYILFDNDEAGIIDGKKLSETTGFTNLILPKIKEAKDVSDLYKELNNKEQFINIILKLFET